MNGFNICTPRKPSTVIGAIQYIPSGETVEFTDPKSFIKEYRDAVETYGAGQILPIRNEHTDYVTLYEIDRIMNGAFCFEVAEFPVWLRKVQQAAL